MSLSDRNQQECIEKLMALPVGAVQLALDVMAAKDAASAARLRDVLKREGSDADRAAAAATAPDAASKARGFRCCS